MSCVWTLVVLLQGVPPQGSCSTRPAELYGHLGRGLQGPNGQVRHPLIVFLRAELTTELTCPNMDSETMFSEHIVMICTKKYMILKGINLMINFIGLLIIAIKLSLYVVTLAYFITLPNFQKDDRS